MKEKILSSVFEKIDSIKSSSKLIFFKGFDIQTLSIMFDKYPRFYDGNYFTNDGIDLLELNNQKKKIMSSILNIEDGTYSGLYEEFIFLSERIDGLYKGEIIIVVNNYFDNFYPSQYVDSNNVLLRQYMNIINEEEVEDSESEIRDIANYISNVVEKENNLFVSYLDRTEEIKVTKLNLIDCNNVKIEIKEIKELQKYVEFSSTNTLDLLDLKLKILNENIPKDSRIDILTEKSILKTTGLLNSLKTLLAVAGEEYDINIYYTSKFARGQVRQEFKQILKQYWNSESFRMLEFYENPDESIDKIKISQGEIIETIVQQVEEAQNSDNYSDIFVTAPTGAGKSLLY
ncbi:hypothetical protein [Anoxybacter fermentans]|uniref:hypothetical protein n=1 Tax=Anoxybacter fermentans TaxID=1323375 RepID=UPI000F8C5429|nr:hypothetical protein [Anoxybacter fermentans]